MSASADPRHTLATTKVTGTQGERAQALHDLCIANVELGNLDTARKLASRGLRLDPPRFHLALAWIELDRGATAQSLRHLDTAMPHLTGRDLARARTLRGLHLTHSAEPRLAIAELSAVIRELRRHHDQRWLANALIGRGIARSYTLRLAEADADFSSAHTILSALGEHGRAAMCLHNKGFVAMLAGQIPRALAHYEDAARQGLDSTSRPEALIDRAEALLAAGLLEDARRVLAPALALIHRCGRGSRLPEALLLAGQLALRTNDLDAAIAHAAQAEQLLKRQGRTTWIPNAKALSLRARLARGEPVATEALKIADRCHPIDAAELRFAAGALTPQRACSAHVMALGWLAKAQNPDRRKALRACKAGLKVIEDHKTALTDAWPATALTSRALDLAGTPREVLRWAERHRTIQSLRPPVLPPDDPELASTLAALRKARAHGEPTEALERDVRRRTLAMARETGTVAVELPDRLISFTLHKGQLLRVIVQGGRARLTRLEEPVDQVNALRLALIAGTTPPAMDLLPGDDFVVVPDGVLHRLPWSALGRRVTVAPSIAHWARARTRSSGTGAVWIAGPGLDHAEREVRELQEEHGGRLVSTVDEALAAMDGARIAHIAAHGHVRTDHPLFSCLRLKDGPLYGYDLERMRLAPEIVVLSACDSGLARVFLDRGTRVVIASVLPVPDDRTRPVMTVLHRELPNGATEAVRRAQQHDQLGFTCYGSVGAAQADGSVQCGRERGARAQ